VTYEQDQVTPDNIDAFLSARVGDGDLLLDLAWNIDNPTILQWCRDHGVRYLNTSVEVWDPYDDMASTHPLDRTLYVPDEWVGDATRRVEATTRAPPQSSSTAPTLGWSATSPSRR
jgi:homospermidine synthase